MRRRRMMRRINSKPSYNQFGPKGIPNNEFIDLSLDEYETIRLIDYQNMTQEECAKSMDVARTTVQRIYSNARNKIADAFINGKTIVIENMDCSDVKRNN